MRARHDAYRRWFRPFVAAAHARGLRVVVEADFPAWPPDLLRWLGPQGVDPANERLWIAYRAAMDELLAEVGADRLCSAQPDDRARGASADRRTRRARDPSVSAEAAERERCEQRESN